MIRLGVFIREGMPPVNLVEVEHLSSSGVPSVERRYTLGNLLPHFTCGARGEVLERAAGRIPAIRCYDINVANWLVIWDIWERDC